MDSQTLQYFGLFAVALAVLVYPRIPRSRAARMISEFRKGLQGESPEPEEDAV